jgi:hypothetical protein
VSKCITCSIARTVTYISFLSVRWGETEYTWHFGHSVGLLYQHRMMMMMIMEKIMKWELTGETEIFAENLTQNQFVPHKSHKT